MPECLLVVAGETLDVEKVLHGCGLTPCRTWKHGEKRSPRSKRINSNSGIKLAISNGDDVKTQIRDATKFVEDHGSVLQSLISAPGVEIAVLDFAWHFDSERSPAQWRTFPIELLRACAAIGLGIELSVYATSSSLDDDSD